MSYDAARPPLDDIAYSDSSAAPPPAQSTVAAVLRKLHEKTSPRPLSMHGSSQQQTSFSLPRASFSDPASSMSPLMVTPLDAPKGGGGTSLTAGQTTTTTATTSASATNIITTGYDVYAADPDPHTLSPTTLGNSNGHGPERSTKSAASDSASSLSLGSLGGRIRRERDAEAAQSGLPVLPEELLAFLAKEPVRPAEAISNTGSVDDEIV